MQIIKSARSDDGIVHRKSFCFAGFQLGGLLFGIPESPGACLVQKDAGIR
ncbi:MAG: hypothetical protein H6696_17445 [Deferribacteres bacterium]|nr:hypothetical protein [Deferribacteres bacterium]